MPLQFKRSSWLKTFTLLGILSSQACIQSGASQLDDIGLRQDFLQRTQIFAGQLQGSYNPYLRQDDPLQPDDCGSIVMPSNPLVPLRGTIVFYHGFTACPQQFYQLARILAHHGIQSFVPLLPGEGRAPTPVGQSDRRIEGMFFKDYYAAFLPRIQNEGWRRYANFVGEVNRFMATLPGKKMVGGLSFGAALASYAYLETPALYSQALLVAPYYGMPSNPSARNRNGSSVADQNLPLTNESLYQLQSEVYQLALQPLSIVEDRELSWGESCYSRNTGLPQQIGRRGICDFRYENLAAVNRFGAFVIDELAKPGPKSEALPGPAIQYVAIEFDNSADTVLTRKALALQQQKWGAERVQLCFYPDYIPHSSFSKQDTSDGSNGFWLNSFLEQALRNLSDAQPFSLDEQTKSKELGFDLRKQSDSTEFLRRCSIYSLDPASIFP